MYHRRRLYVGVGVCCDGEVVNECSICLYLGKRNETCRFEWAEGMIVVQQLAGWKRNGCGVERSLRYSEAFEVVGFHI